MTQFAHPKIVHGSISQGSNVYRVIDGRVDCPDEFGYALGLKPVSAADADSDSLRPGGPTLEEYEKRGFKPENYPPPGWAEVSSPRLTEFREQQAKRQGEDEQLRHVLEGPVPTVIETVATTPDLALLARLESFEIGGKNRKGVLEAVAARRIALHPSNT